MAIADLNLSAAFENVDDAESLSVGEESFIQAVRGRVTEYSQRTPNLHGLLTSDPAQFSHTLRQLKTGGILNGLKFCEWGSGIGMMAGLAALNGWDACGIELDPSLCREATKLAEEFAVNVVFARGSFVPVESAGVFSVRGVFGATQWAPDTDRDPYHEIGRRLSEMDLVYAYPWPRELPIYEALFDLLASPGAVLWMYRHRSTPKLIQKTDA